MPIFTLRTECLKVIIPFISKEPTRYYLNGVFFQAGILVATDGHRLAAIKPIEFYGESGADFILEKTIIEKIMKVQPELKKTPVYVSFDTTTKIAQVHHGISEDHGKIILSAFPYKEIDGTFPDWRRVLPTAAAVTRPAKPAKGSTDSENRAGFNISYLADFKVFGKIVSVFLNTDPHGPCIIRAKNSEFDAFGVLMPAREDTELTPEWLAPKPTTVKE